MKPTGKLQLSMVLIYLLFAAIKSNSVRKNTIILFETLILLSRYWVTIIVNRAEKMWSGIFSWFAVNLRRNIRMFSKTYVVLT